jgi:hypothetical protein
MGNIQARCHRSHRGPESLGLEAATIGEKMMDEIEKAKQLLKRNGFAVIPREAIKTLGAEKAVPDRDLAEHASKEGFLRHIRSGIFHSMVDVLEREPQWVKLDKKDDPSRPYYTVFTARMQVIPHTWEIDPILEMLREQTN